MHESDTYQISRISSGPDFQRSYQGRRERRAQGFPSLHEIRSAEALKQLHSNPPSLTAILSDSIVYARSPQGKWGYEPSDSSWDRIEAAFEINQEFPESKFLTLSTSFDNIGGMPDAVMFSLNLEMMKGFKPNGYFPEMWGTSYDTVTELIEVLCRTTFPNPFGHDNIAIITGTKQTERVRVMLDSLLNYDRDPEERARIDRYFQEYMPARLKGIHEDAPIHEDFKRYLWLVYERELGSGEELRKKNFTIVPSEDITGTNLRDRKAHESNLKGVKDWLAGTYGQSYIDSAESGKLEQGIRINIKHLTPQEAEQRKRIPYAGTPEAEGAGISWGFGRIID